MLLEENIILQSRKKILQSILVPYKISLLILYYIIISGTDFDIIEGEVSMYVKRKDAVPRHLLHFIKKGVVLIFWQLKMSVKKE